MDQEKTEEENLDNHSSLLQETLQETPQETTDETLDYFAVSLLKIIVAWCVGGQRFSGNANGSGVSLFGKVF